MNKKIKISLPRYVVEIVEKDKNYFSISKDAIYNKILAGVGFNKIRKIETSIFDKKISVCFNLNNKNFSLFYEMLKFSKIEVENEFIRTLLIDYSNTHPSIREKLLNATLFRELEYAIKNKKMIKILYNEEVIDIFPLVFERDKNTYYNNLKVSTKGEQKNLKIKDIEILKIL
ncbi:MAG: hypothetical protein Q7K47_08325 [Fusobacterium sp. JB019]|nr:hypothetical protein [Fusobacterium sp. JB019]